MSNEVEIRDFLHNFYHSVNSSHNKFWRTSLLKNTILFKYGSMALMNGETHKNWNLVLSLEEKRYSLFILKI